MKIVVVGAGGLGGLLGSVLHEAGRDVHLVARGAHLDALRAHGLTVVTEGRPQTHNISASDGTDALSDVDLAVVTVKTHSLDGVAGLAAALADAGAWVVPLVNGVDAAERLIEGGVDGSRVIPGIAYLTAFRTAPGVITRSGRHQRLLFGVVGTDPSRSDHPLRKAFAHTGVSVDIVPDIDRELWKKMAVVCALSALCGRDNTTIGEVRSSRDSELRHGRSVREVVAVARAQGVDFTDQDALEVHRTLASFGDSFFPSLVHDLRSGISTEVDALCGTIVRLGAQAGIPTPFYEDATRAIVAHAKPS